MIYAFLSKLNFDLKFIELSCVGDGAFESCEIQEIYDVDDVLSAAEDLEKKANELSANIVLALQETSKKSSLSTDTILNLNIIVKIKVFHSPAYFLVNSLSILQILIWSYR